MKPDNTSWLTSTKPLLWVGMFAVLLVVGVAVRRPPQSPTFFRLMDTRYRDMLKASDGLQGSGVPLVGWWQGKYIPAGAPDDLGLYILVPELAQVLHLQLATAYDLICWVLILFAATIGGIGLGTLHSRADVLFGLALLLAARAGDVYLFEALPAVAGV